MGKDLFGRPLAIAICPGDRMNRAFWTGSEILPTLAGSGAGWG